MNLTLAIRFLARWALPCLLAAGWPLAAAACPYTIRDSGYIVTEPTPFQVCFVIDDQTPAREQVRSWVKNAAATALAHSNLQTHVLDLSADKKGRLYRAYETVGKPSPPAVVLVSPRGNALTLPLPGAGTVTEAAVKSVVSLAASSPAREKLKAALVDPWCVIVVATGSRPGVNQQVMKTVQTAVASVKKILRQADEKRFRLPEIVSVSLTDPREQVFLWSLGLLEGDRSSPRVAVVFGRGRRLGAVLEGSRLTAENVGRLLWLLAQNCACTSDPSWLLGPVVPLVWPRSLQARVVAKLGFDPQSPGAFASLSGVWTSLGERAPAATSSDDLGYLELVTPSRSGGSSTPPTAGAASSLTPSVSAPSTAQPKATPGGGSNAAVVSPSPSHTNAALPAKPTPSRPQTKAVKKATPPSAPKSPPRPKKPPARKPTPPSAQTKPVPDTQTEPALRPPPPSATVTPPVRRSEPTMALRVNRVLIYSVGLLVLVALGAGLAMVWWRGRER